MARTKSQRTDTIINLWTDGISFREIARKLEINPGTVWYIIDRAGLRNRNTDKQDPGMEYVKRYAPDFEYVGGYTGKEGHIDIRCKSCGTVINRTCWMLRHRSIECPACKAKQRSIKREQDRIIKETERIQSRAEAERKRIEREAEKKRKAEEAWHDCPVCGSRTNRKKYCSDECMKKANWHTKEAKRRLKIEANLIDKDITLSSLFKRDGGVCYICGCKCQYDDFTIVDGAKITGDWYPSIDHVVPLARGGEHSWKNIRLAHRRCNYLKSDNAPPSLFLAENNGYPPLNSDFLNNESNLL